MTSILELIGCQILRESKLKEKVSADLEPQIQRQLGAVTAVAVSLLTVGLLLHFLETTGLQQGLDRHHLTNPTAFQGLLALMGYGLAIRGFFPIAFGALYRVWVTRRWLFAIIAAASLGGVSFSPTMGLGLISLTPLMTVALDSPDQARACAAAADGPCNRQCGRRAKRRKARKCK